MDLDGVALIEACGIGHEVGRRRLEVGVQGQDGRGQGQQEQ